MKQEDLSLIGTEVSYVRLDENDQIIEGRGDVWAIFLSEDKRIQIRVHDKIRDQKLNIDCAAINCEPHERDAYIAGCLKVRKHAKDVNTKIKEMTSEANAHIETMQVEFLGAPFEL